MVYKQTQKPETEVKLTELQDKYLENRDIKTYQEIFTVLHSYARSLILKKTTGKIYLPKELVDNATLESCVKFMESYKKPDFKIETSFAGLLNLKILESLYGPKIKAEDKISSLNSYVDTLREKELELGDIPEKLGFKYLFRPDSIQCTVDPVEYLFDKDEDAIKSVMTVLNELYTTSDLKHFMLVSIAILLFLRKNKKFDKYKMYFLDNKTRGVLDLSILEIRNRLANVA